jgi:hypothetical protein
MTLPRTRHVSMFLLACWLWPGFGSHHPDAGEAFLSVSEIRPGMRGVGRTVFQGTEPEEFQVEILGVLRNAIGPGQDLILSRLRGSNVERTGVVAGMSGSPVTVDGKLVGAIAYRMGNFEKEPIAGITPIADMLRAADLPGGSASAATAFERAAGWIAEWAGEGSRDPRAGAGVAADLSRIATPLVFSGFPEAVLRTSAPLFRARGLEPVQGGGATGETSEYPIEPGVAVAAQLVRGDLSLAGTGTLTHVDGERIWAFGHPFLGGGAVRYPMSRAEILVTFPSAAGSFKIANATSPLGTLVQDRLTCIQGRLGETPRMIPVTVRLTTPGGSRDFAYEIVEERTLAPLLLAITTQASLQRVVEFSSEATYRAEMIVDLEGRSPARFATVETDLGGLQAAAPAGVAREMAGIFNAVLNNRFEEAGVRSVRLGISAIPEARLARITDVAVSPAEIRPGDEFRVTVTVEPYRAKPFQKVFRVRVPPDTQGNTVGLVVGSARVLTQIEAPLLQRRFLGAAALDQVLRFLAELREEDRLYLQLTRRGLGAVVEGEVLPSLPLSILHTLGSNRFAGDEVPAADLPVLELSEPTEYVLLGGRRTSLRLR